MLVLSTNLLMAESISRLQYNYYKKKFATNRVTFCAPHNPPTDLIKRDSIKDQSINANNWQW